MMERYKELEIARMEDPFFDVPDYPVGAQCFQNEILHKYVKSFDSLGICHYSRKQDYCVPFVDIVKHIHDIISTFFTDPGNEAGWDSHFDDEGNVPGFVNLGGGYIVPENKTHYEDSETLLSEEGLSVRYQNLFDDIINALPEQLWVEQDLYGLNEAENRTIDWRELEQKARDLKQAGIDIDYSNLPVADRARLFNILGTVQSLSHQLIKRQPIKVYRVVKYNEPIDPVEFTKLTSPPVQFTKDLRMSKAGDSIFYGASTIKCASSESVGDEKALYYIGEFESQHPLIILDLRHIRQRIGIFDVPTEDYYNIVFLDYFAKQISRNLDDKHPEDYSATQLISEYFRNNLKLYLPDGNKLPIDGIMYDSSKVNGDYNVALFYDNAASANHLNLLNYKIIDNRNQ